MRVGLLKASVVVLDVAAVVVGLLGAHALWTWARPHLELLLHIRWFELLLPNPFMPSALVLGAAWILLLRQAGLYDPGRMTSSARIAGGVSQASAVLLVLVMVLQFLLPDRTYSRLLIVAFCAACSGATLALRLVFFQVQKVVPRPITQEKVAVVGVSESAQAMAERLGRYGHRLFRLAGYLRPKGEEDDVRVPEEQILGDLSELRELVNTHDLRVIVIAAQGIAREDALLLANQAGELGLRVLQVPLTWGVASPRVELTRLGGLQLIDLTTLAYPTLATQLKRTLDLVLVTLGGLVILPLLLPVMAAIKLQDGGPIFYIQPRAGKGGRVFPFYKLRSMVVDAEARRAELDALNEADGVLFKMENDPRITPLGRTLRKYSIDELPQLFNVLRGDMNLVGPRPLPMGDLAPVSEDPELRYWFELRSKVKPGITGPWQVMGRSELGFKEMVRHDIDYIQNWSLWLDVVMLLKTVPAVLRGRGAH